MKSSWKLPGALILTIFILPVLGALGWVGIEAIFAGTLSAGQLHPLSSGSGFWTGAHFALHFTQIAQVMGVIWLVLAVCWVFAQCDEFRDENPPKPREWRKIGPNDWAAPLR